MSEWKLVPVEPTEEMMRAAVLLVNGEAVYRTVPAGALKIEEQIFGEAYSAMLAASPPAPSAEPVAWLYQHGETGRTRIVMPDQVFTNGPNQWLLVGPLYQHPPAPLQPVAWLDEEHDCAYTRAMLDGGSEQGMRPLYASPPDDTALLRQALEALKYHVEQTRPITRTTDAIDALRAALGEK